MLYTAGAELSKRAAPPSTGGVEKSVSQELRNARPATGIQNPETRESSKKTQKITPGLSGTGDSQRDSRESIRANHSQSKPLFL